MKKILLLFTALCFALGISAQQKGEDVVYLNNGSVIKGVIERVVDNVSVSIRTRDGNLLTYPAVEVRRVAYGTEPIIPGKSKNPNSYKDYSTYETGFWWSAELQGGFSCNLEGPNLGMLELDALGGYRFNQYAKIGLGFGARYYFNNDDIRYSSIKWAFPLYVNVRGNFIPEEHRTMVPYYSMDLGAAFRDGVFFRPTIGVRVGSAQHYYSEFPTWVSSSMASLLTIIWLELKRKNTPPSSCSKWVMNSKLKDIIHT